MYMELRKRRQNFLGLHVNEHIGDFFPSIPRYE